MIRNSFVLFLLCLLTSQVFGQISQRFGVSAQGGIPGYRLGSAFVETYVPQLSYSVGCLYSFSPVKQLSIEAGIALQSDRFQINYVGINVDPSEDSIYANQVYYISLPLQVQWQPSQESSWFFGVGIQPEYLLGGESSWVSFDQRFNTSILISTGFQVTPSLTIRGQGQLGRNDILSDFQRISGPMPERIWFRTGRYQIGIVWTIHQFGADN